MVHLFFELMAMLKNQLLYNDIRITIVISDLIISEGIYFNLSQKPRLDKVLELSRNISKTYITPNRNLISKELLDAILEHNTKRNLAII